MQTELEEALKNYQSAYDDGQFRRLQMTIVAEVCGPMQLMSERSIELGKNATADILSLVIKCAEYLCGFDYVDPFVELRAAMLKVKKTELVEAIYEYLRPYQDDQDTLEKFRHTTLTALVLGKVESQLVDTLSELAQERQGLRIAALETTDDLIDTIRRLIDIARNLLLDA